MAFDSQTADQQHEDTLQAEAAQLQGRDVLIPLNRLFLSPTNVRRTRNKTSIPELAALIASQGLLQRLCVTDAGEGRFAVEAGGRRLEALELLAGVGEPASLKQLADLGVTLNLPLDAQVECKLVDQSRAVEVSAAENSGREEMHVADQIETFASLIATGLTEKQVAVRFGVSPLTVQRRLTLAGVAPRFLQMLREDSIDLDLLQALSLAKDHETQIAAWESLPHYHRSAYMIRQALTEKELEGNSRLAKFVGVDAYIAAGGAVRRDLFASDGDCWFQDPALAQKLAMERLEAVAEEERASGWSWVEVHMTVDYQMMNRFDQERPRMRRASDEEAAGIEEWKAAAEAARLLIEPLERAWHAAPAGSAAEAAAAAPREEAKAHAASIRQGLAEVQSLLAEWSAKQLATCGVIVTIDGRGAIEIKRGLMRPADRKAIVAELKKSGKPVPTHLQTTNAVGGGASGERAAFSERLMHDLTAHRTAALQAALVDNAHVALALVVHRLIEPIVSSHRYYGSDGPLKLSGTLTKNTPLDARASDYAESQAAAVLAATASRVGDEVPGQGIFAWLLSQDDAKLMELLAFCAASSLDAMHGREQATYNTTDALADALGVDMADW